MLRCRDLKELPSLAHLKYIAGLKNLDNIIRWPYVTETITISNWVHGGELLIISGAVVNKKNFNLIKIVEEAIENQLAGVLILIGDEYVPQNSISGELINLANKASFPLMLIPWNIPLVDIMEDVGSSIINHANIEKSSIDVISSIIFSEKIQEDSFSAQCELMGYNIFLPQQIMMLQFYNLPAKEKIKNPFIFDSTKKEDIKDIILSEFNSSNVKLLISSYSNNVVALFQSLFDNSNILEHITSNIEEKIKKFYPSIQYNIGIGKSYNRIPLIKRSFHEASKCIQLLNKLNHRNTVYFYEKLGLYRLFIELEKGDVLSEYIEQTLGMLIEYDTNNNTTLVDTLKVYLNKNGNIIEASKEMFIHRNTLKYRINRIEEITNRSLSDSYTRLDFQNALIIKEMLD